MNETAQRFEEIFLRLKTNEKQKNEAYEEFMMILKEEDSLEKLDFLNSFFSDIIKVCLMDLKLKNIKPIPILGYLSCQDHFVNNFSGKSFLFLILFIDNFYDRK